MANMNQEQRDLLHQLEVADAEYNAYVEALEEELAQKKWEAREKTRNLVREARNASVPYRQIGIALGTSDHQTIKNFESDRRK